MRINRPALIAVTCGTLALGAPAAQASAPGWSTPHTAPVVTTGIYAAGSGGQGVQLFANGGVQQRTGQLRAIRTDATQGTAVGVNAGAPGFDLDGLSINDDGRLVAAWSMDLENATPVSVAAALGSRTSLPRTATVFATGALVSDLATAVSDDGTGIVAWVQAPIGATIASATTIRVATLRTGQAPIVTTVATRAGAFINDLGVGFDSSSRPVVTWSVAPDENTGPGILGVARGTGVAGAFSPAVETTVEPTQPLVDLETFVTGDGGLLLFWSSGAAPGPVGVRYSQATAAGAFAAPRTLISGGAGSGRATFAANAAGRAAVVFPLATGSGTSLRVLLRTSAGTWGSARLLGPSGARTTGAADVGVDGKGRVVALWADASSSTPNRILAARSSSSSNPLNTYNQVSQRSGDRRCASPALALASSGDGLGSWLCSTASSGAINGPRLARLTSPS